MIGALKRKARQVAADPVLRRWLTGRLLGRWPGEPAYQAHRPPYLADCLPLPEEPPSWNGQRLAGNQRPRIAINLPLPGRHVDLTPDEPDVVFDLDLTDTETVLGLHRFAWVPVMGEGLDPHWVNLLWKAWLRRFSTPNDDWPWHPYTAAERAINILDFATRHGLPGKPEETLACLAAHAPAIAKRLEYFGDHHTSNHLANNGRGLFRLGLALNLPKATELGAAILVNEAERIFRPSGVLREGSSHYHLLLARQYCDCWLAAARADHPAAGSLKSIAAQALAVVPHLALPGGLPLIGDISPDCPPDHLIGLTPGCDLGLGWGGTLADRDRAALQALRDETPAVEAAALAEDGWCRLDHGDWHGLWHVATDGWSQMPGHGHQDIGAFELHYGDEAIFRDPGRGAYGEEGEAALYRSAAVHGGLWIDDHDPYPANKPYYGAAFRQAVCGPAPQLIRHAAGPEVQFDGNRRFPGLGRVRRHWQFEDRRMVLGDHVTGRGRHKIARQFVTTLPVEVVDGGCLLQGRNNTYRLSGGAPVSLKAITCWRAYGEGTLATLIRFECRSRLPFQGQLILEVL